MKKNLPFVCLCLFLSFSVNLLFSQTQKGSTSVSFHSKNWEKESKDIIAGGAMFIPDGPVCPTQCYEDSIEVTGFPVGITVDTITDIESICLRIEHSYSGDLGFSIICPNGQTAVLHPNNHGGNAYLGEPKGGTNHDLFDSNTNPCDPMYNSAGIGWTYGWSEIYPNHGTYSWLAMNSTTIEPTDMITQQNYILPEFPIYDSLQGCPLNGLWKLRICDDFASDNGWVFGWEITYNGHKNILGNVFYDVNEDGIRDTLESGIANQIIRIDPGPYYTTTKPDGSYGFCRDSASYTLTYVPQLYWGITTDSLSYSFTTTDPLVAVSGFDFGTAPFPGITDVGINYSGMFSRANHDENYWLNYKNCGTFTQQGTVHLAFDTLLTFVSSTIPPDVQTGNVIEWNYNSLLMLENRQIGLVFHMPDITHIGDTIISACWITPIAGDTNIINNFDTLKQLIKYPFDPNYKEVTPKGEGAEGYVLHGQELTYTIHFQNVGTDTARSIMIIDSIDSDMKVESFTLLAASHPMTYDIYGAGIVKFIFPNIMLPDSSTNDLGSQGFVKFSLKPKLGLPDFTKATNKGYILFDYNPAIITNQVLNTYVSNINVNTDIISAKNNFILFPNPFSNTSTLRLSTPAQNASLIIYDILGKEIKRMTNLTGKEIIIQRENMKAGMYFFRIEDKIGVVGIGKMIVE